MSTRGPATRRSSRLASNDPSPAPLSAFPTNIAGRTRSSATPGPSTDRRGRSGAETSSSSAAAGPLPPIQATSSHAYGSSGRTSLKDPTRLLASYASPNLALDDAREDAVARDSSPLSTGAHPTFETADFGTPVPGSPIAESPLSDPGDRRSSLVNPSLRGSVAPRNKGKGKSTVFRGHPAVSPGPSSPVNASNSFGTQHEAGPAPRHGFRVQNRVQNRVRELTNWEIFCDWCFQNANRFREWIGQRAPNAPIAKLLWSLIIAYLLSLMLGYDIPQPDGTPLHKARESLYKSMSNAGRIPGAVTGAVTSVFSGASQHDAAIARLNQQFLEEQARYGELSDRYDEINAELVKLKGMLPELTVVRRKQDGTGFELLDHFWTALEAKAIGERIKGNKGTWQNWVNRNEELVGEVKRAQANDYDAVIAWGLKQYSLVTKDEVLQILRQHYDQYDARQERTFEATAERLLDKHFKSGFKVIEGAWAHKTVYNLRLSQERPNFMSSKLGATIDPSLTSPTANVPFKRWQSWFYGRALRAAPPANAPIEALRSWEEAGDCWCSAEEGVHNHLGQPRDFGISSDGKGRAQLGVDLARNVYPSHFVLEHVPQTGTLSPGTTPRDVELWAHVPSEDARKALKKSLEVASWHGGKCGNKGGNMPDDFVCIGTMKYNIDGWNHVQTSALEVDFKALDVAVKKVVVRVQNTWGAPRACLYRVRLLGEQAPFPVTG